jgi:hypothetical protein
MAKGGFDEFGYNYQARVFVGKADGVDRVLDGAVWGDPTYANDHLVMKWSKAWDDARFHGAPWTPDAWEDNEWNGAVPGGSGEVWHYKIIWVGPIQNWDVRGTWNFAFTCTIGCEGTYLHTMTITTFDSSTGEFSGTGFYNDNHAYIWTVTGKVSGNTFNFTLVYTGLNQGYTLTGTGEISSDGTKINGTANGPGQTFTWTATTTGLAIPNNGPYWRDGGYRIWGEFEVIMDQGTAEGVHTWFAHAIPTGYGA